MQPAATPADGSGVKLLKGEAADEGLVNTQTFMRKRLEDVPVDQVCALASVQCGINL
jgi:ribosome biogenesis protein MAK21